MRGRPVDRCLTANPKPGRGASEREVDEFRAKWSALHLTAVGDVEAIPPMRWR